MDKKTKPFHFQGILLPDGPDTEDIRQIAPDYECIIYEVLIALLDRFERRPDYPFIDTKLDLTTGQDFPTDDLLRGLGTVYGWIQGRGLEASAGHATWLRKHSPHLYQVLGPRIKMMMQTVLDSLREFRLRNGGHLFFFMKPDGTAFVLNDDGESCEHPLNESSPCNFSDQFSAKGMLAVARFLGDSEAEKEAQIYCREVECSVWENHFVTDQQSLDPKLSVQFVEGKYLQGAYMILLSAAAVRAESADDDQAVESGLELMRHVLKHHSNEDGDFWEAIDGNGQPYIETDGTIVSDPGHALEFVGLALKFIQTSLNRRDINLETRNELKSIAAIMPNLLMKNFANGFQVGPGGICKSFDLISRKVINGDMPWWSLPETMRTALACHRVAKNEAAQQKCLNIFSACHNSFFQHYLLPEVHYMAIQTRSADGSVSKAIPATTDADPGYHTGLSLIDCLELTKTVTQGTS